jgi:dCMP deaminase
VGFLLSKGNYNMKTKYKVAFMKMALAFGSTSAAKRKKVGVVIVKGEGYNAKVISQGVNGQPPGHPSEVCECADNHTLPSVRHAEIAAFDKVIGKSELENTTMFVTLSPCISCAEEMVKYKLSKVYYLEGYRCGKGLDYLRSSGVEVEQLHLT